MNTQDSIRVQSQKPPEQLEREIDQQRQHIEQLVDALQNKLSPGELFERALQLGKGGGGELAGQIGRTVKDNPLPALMTAAGLLWLYSSRPGAAHGTSGEHLGAARERVGEGAHRAKEALKDYGHRAGDGFNHMLEENPLAVGALGVAIGAMLGALVPLTERERELLGDRSERMRDQVRDLAERSREEVGRAVRDITEPLDRAGGHGLGHAGVAGATSAGPGVSPTTH